MSLNHCDNKQEEPKNSLSRPPRASKPTPATKCVSTPLTVTQNIVSLKRQMVRFQCVHFVDYRHILMSFRSLFDVRRFDTRKARSRSRYLATFSLDTSLESFTWSVPLQGSFIVSMIMMCVLEHWVRYYMRVLVLEVEVRVYYFLLGHNLIGSFCSYHSQIRVYSMLVPPFESFQSISCRVL